MGKFQPGCEKPKNSGRQRGTPNKKTTNLQEALEAYGLDMAREIAELLPQLTVDKRADVWMDLLSYIYPKRKAVEASDPSAESQAQVFVYIPKNGREAPGTVYSQDPSTSDFKTRSDK